MQALRPASRFFMSWQGRVRKRRREQETRDTRSRPQVPSLRSPVPRLSSPVFRLPSFVSRLSSFVFRPPSLRSPEGAVAIRNPRPNPRLSSKRGESNGGGAPLVVGEGVQRGPPRNRSPLAVSFPRSAKSPRPVFVPAAAGDSPSVLRIRRSPVLFVPPVPSPPAGRFL